MVLEESTPLDDGRDHTLAWEELTCPVDDQIKEEAITNLIIGNSNSGNESATGVEDDEGGDDDNVKDNDRTKLRECLCSLPVPVGRRCSDCGG